jgi:hypothetical protein
MKRKQLFWLGVGIGFGLVGFAHAFWPGLKELGLAALSGYP